MFNVALIGCGYWGSKLKRYIEENKEFNLRYVCNSKTDLKTVWDDVDSVVIAVRNEPRYAIVREALLQGKNVFTEKPLALNNTEASELRNLALKYNLTLVLDYTWTFSKGLLKAVDLIKEGIIGDILGFNMCVKHLGRFYGGSVYWLLGSHMLSVLDMFVPLDTLKFQSFDLVKYDGNVETGIITFNNQQMSGTINISLNNPKKEVEVIIYGSKGTLVFSPFNLPQLYMVAYKRLVWTLDIPRSRTEYNFDEYNNLRYAIKYFSNVMKGEAESNLDMAVKITEILEDIQNDRKLN